MKKRILSLLLLVALLVTGIPVMAISAEETPVYTNEDVLGVELCGAMKNIMAICQKTR